MTICTQNFKIPFISFPIFETARPGISPFLWGKFGALIDMVYVKNSKIIISAVRTFSTQGLDKFNLTFPITALLLKFITLFIPITLLTFWCAKLCYGWLAAIEASTSCPPSFGHVAIPRAIFSIAKSNTTRARLKMITTMFTIFNNGCFLHNSIIPQLPINYAIAERRIALAPMQPNLFQEAQP